MRVGGGRRKERVWEKYERCSLGCGLKVSLMEGLKERFIADLLDSSSERGLEKV